MSAAAGRRIPVVPVVAFLGRGKVIYYGRPPEGCIVTTYGDLGRALNAHGNRIRESTIQKLLVIAAQVDRATVGQYLGMSSSARGDHSGNPGRIPSQRETAR